MNETILIYKGDGSKAIPGLPLRDLTEKDIDGFTIAQLVASGLYKKPPQKKDGK